MLKLDMEATLAAIKAKAVERAAELRAKGPLDPIEEVANIDSLDVVLDFHRWAHGATNKLAANDYIDAAALVIGHMVLQAMQHVEGETPEDMDALARTILLNAYAVVSQQHKSHESERVSVEAVFKDVGDA